MLNVRRHYLRLRFKSFFSPRNVRFRLNYLSTFLLVLCLASIISYNQPFGLLHTIRHIHFTNDVDPVILQQVIEDQKRQQKIAFEWLRTVLYQPSDHPSLISPTTHRSRFFDYMQWSGHQNLSYTLFGPPPKLSINSSDHILISILYGRKETSYQEGKFYLGQVLHHLLKSYHSRFIITLCESDNTDEKTTEEIEVLRSLLPVFIVTNISADSTNPFEREKDAHLQCILANFRSFPAVNYFLLLQDDAKPIHTDFYTRLSSFIDQRLEHRWLSNGIHDQYPGFIKIYHPRWLIDYFNPSIFIVTQLFATSLLLALMAWVGLCWYQKRTEKTDKIGKDQSFQRYSRRYHGFEPITLKTILNYIDELIKTFRSIWNFLYCFVLITLTLLLLNHTNISWPWRSLHPTFYALHGAPSCCLPGVLYFRSTYEQVIDHLRRSRCRRGYAIDMVLDDLTRRTGLETFLIEPNLLHHIGLYSRLRHTYISPYLLD